MLPAYIFDPGSVSSGSPFGLKLLSSPQFPGPGSIDTRYPLLPSEPETPSLTTRLSLPFGAFWTPMDRSAQPEFSPGGLP